MAAPASSIVALILAGGLARRMGGADKALLNLAGEPLLAHVARALGAPAIPLAISANGEPARLASFGFPVLPDADESRPGPLGGILAGLIWAKAKGASALLSAPVDCPFLPADLLPRFQAASAGGRLVHARAGGRDHPTVALWPVALAPILSEYLACGERRMMGFMTAQEAECVEWAGDNLFLNLNTPEDLAAAETLLAQRPNT